MANAFGVTITATKLQKICSISPVTIRHATNKEAALVICLDAIINGASGQGNQERRKGILIKCGITLAKDMDPTVWAFGKSVSGVQFKQLCAVILAVCKDALETCTGKSLAFWGTSNFWPECEHDEAKYKAYKASQEAKKAARLDREREQAASDGG
eukprot:GHVU01160483.1.p1 GENE.GHVU01160483.1~~GHVU01160483.1.p1  ORF type:complete len:156 (+),score=28.50 GHVU01160483.1:29-496(+)